jgi:hypothetical protein
MVEYDDVASSRALIRCARSVPSSPKHLGIGARVRHSDYPRDDDGSLIQCGVLMGGVRAASNYLP